MAETLRKHNVEATFTDRATAERAARKARRDLRVDVSLDGSQDNRAVLRAEMRDEMSAVVAGPGSVGPFTKSMSRGIATWVPIGTVVGAALGAAVGLIPWPGLDLLGRVLAGVAIGGGAGATVGFVAGGGFRPRTEREGSEMAAERGVVVGVHTDDEEEAARAEALLAGEGPERLDRVDEHGYPVGPAAEELRRPIRGEVPTTSDGGDAAPPEDPSAPR